MIVEKRMETYIDSLSPDLPEYLLQLERRALEEEVPVIRKSMQNYLRFFLERERPETILEVGAAVGFSALLMREYTDASITTIEKVPGRIQEAQKNFAKYDSDGRITLMPMDADQAFSLLAQEGKQFDCIFMDAAKGQYLCWLPCLMRLLSDEGVLISDNVLQDGDIMQSRYAVVRRDRTIHGRMRRYLYTLMHTEGLKTAVLPVGDGITVSYITDRERLTTALQEMTASESERKDIC